MIWHSTRRPPRFPKIRSPDKREATVVRPHEEPTWAEEMLARERDPHRPENYSFEARLHGQLMGALEDEAFLVSMRNRLRMLERERAAPAFWRRFKGMLFGAPESNEIAGFELKRLRHLAGEPPPENLPDYVSVSLSYEELLRLVTAGQAAAKATEPTDRTG